MVRRELGPQAAILHCREIRRSALGKLWHGTGVEVAAAPSLPKRKQATKRVTKPMEEQPLSIKSIPTENPRLNLLVEDVNELQPKPVVNKSTLNEKQFVELREKLLDADLASDLVDQLIAQARKDFHGVEDLEQTILVENLVQQLTGYLSVSGPLKKLTENTSHPKIVTLVGPTGVGKNDDHCKARCDIEHCRRTSCGSGNA